MVATVAEVYGERVFILVKRQYLYAWFIPRQSELPRALDIGPPVGVDLSREGGSLAVSLWVEGRPKLEGLLVALEMVTIIIGLLTTHLKRDLPSVLGIILDEIVLVVLHLVDIATAAESVELPLLPTKVSGPFALLDVVLLVALQAI